MTPAEFNALPLEQQLKQLQPGDELHLRSGGFVIFEEYRKSNGTIWSNHGMWTQKTIAGFGSGKSDITRVIRPAPKNQCTFPKCDGNEIVDDCCHKPRVNCRFPGKDCQAGMEDSSCWAVCGGLSPAPKEQPENVAETHKMLRNQINAMCGEADIAQLVNCILMIADHFEREAGK